jgi:histidine triad (HIT) family protein
MSTKISDGAGCIFCQIVEKKISSPIIYEDDSCIVIPDKFPATEGQTLVIIKKHIPYFLDLPDDLYLHILKVSK